jgi:hypothetical protein
MKYIQKVKGEEERNKADDLYEQAELACLHVGNFDNPKSKFVQSLLKDPKAYLLALVRRNTV